MSLSTVVDLRPLVDQIIVPIVIPVVASVVVWGAKKGIDLIAAKLQLHGLHIDAQQRQAADDILGKLIAGELATLTHGVAGAGPLTIDMKSQAIASVAQKAIEHGPATLAHFGITSENDPRLATMIENRIEIALAQAKASVDVNDTKAATIAAAAAPAA